MNKDKLQAAAQPCYEALESRRLFSAVLTGTVIGTPGSYRNHGTTIADAFDGNFTTYFDGPDASGDWAGLSLSAPAIITSVSYAPRTGWASRMIGGVFQGSNSANFSTGVVNLYTVTASPVGGAFTSAPVSSSQAFSYVRYLGPGNSYCDVAELQFSGNPATTTTKTPLAVTVTGTAGSYNNSGNTINKAFDSNLNTFFDGPTASGDFITAQFSSEAVFNQISYAPRSGYTNRMVGGIFQGSNTAAFTSGVVNLYTITKAPTAGVYTSVAITNSSAFEYVKYVAPGGSNGDVAELAYYGTLTGIQATAGMPSVTSSNPTNGATGVSTTASVSCALNLPNGGIDPGTEEPTTVYLYRTSDHAIIPSNTNTDAAGSTIVLQPQSPLAANTNYTFVVTSGVKDNTGAAFKPYQISFTTGAQTAPTDPNIAFQKVALSTTTGQDYTCVTMGPDGDLYASTLTGAILQFPVNADGTLGTGVNLTAGDPPMLITGVAFDPSSTASKMTLWISEGDVQEVDAPNFTGVISAITITGSTASPVVDYVTGLPRSNSNHMNDQPVFGPDGALYFCQGSMTSMGAPDEVWGYRAETILSAAVLRLNVQEVEAYVATNHKPLDVEVSTLPAGPGMYDPTAPGAPLTLYVTGIRNAYDLVWDTNGHLYVPTNGASAGGNIPATPPGVTPIAPAENGVGVAEDDFVYDVSPGHYYGHPNPSRGEWIFAGGNPYNPKPNTQVEQQYPLGTNPDPRYPGYAYDFGLHYSPDGAIEYTGSAFGGALNGALLVTEYSSGKDIIALTVGSSGQITQGIRGITGFTGFTDPLDITEDDANGYLYVADLGAQTITLLKPIASGAAISTSTSTAYFNDVANSTPSATQTLTISNTGTQPLAIPATGLSIIGANASLFTLSSSPALPAIIAPGGSISIGIGFNAGTSAVGVQTAQLQIASNARSAFTLVNLRGLTTAGVTPALSPSLQSIFNLFQIPENAANAEVPMQELEKAGTGAVTITPLASFAADITPSAGFGFYTAGSPGSASGVFTINAANSQLVTPAITGANSFDPGSDIFGIYGSFEAFANPGTGTARLAYSEDALNTFDTTNPHKVKFYPYQTSTGSIVPGEFVFAIEDNAAAPYDFNALVGLITNVMPAPAEPKISVENVDGADTLSAPSPTAFVFSSIANSNGSNPVVHSTDDLRIVNTGNQPLMVASLSSSNAAFSVATELTFPINIGPGSSVDLNLVYDPTDTGINAVDTGTVAVDSNDPVTPALALNLTGIWQSAPGVATVPTLPQIVGAFGYTTTITNPGQSLNQSGQIMTAGQEVLSSYWTRVDANLPVTVQQLAAFNSQTNGSALYWYSQGHSSTFSKILSIAADNNQSLLPLESDATNSPSIGFCSPTGTFGLSVDQSEFSDNALNHHGNSLDQGHHMRFWPVYNAANQLVPNTWLMAMDYTSPTEGYTYTANVYFISNIKPAPPAMPTGVNAVGGSTGITISWNPVNDQLLAGYVVYRSTSLSGVYTRLNPGALTTPTYTDSTVTAGTTYYYTVAAYDSYGDYSPFTTAVSAAVPSATVAAVIGDVQWDATFGAAPRPA